MFEGSEAVGFEGVGLFVLKERYKIKSQIISLLCNKGGGYFELQHSNKREKLIWRTVNIILEGAKKGILIIILKVHGRSCMNKLYLMGRAPKIH